MRRPLFALAIALCLGILFAAKISLPFPAVYALMAVTLIACFLFIRKEAMCDILLLCLTFLLGTSLLINSCIYSHNHISKFLSSKSIRVLIEGVLESDISFDVNGSYFTLRVEHIKIADRWQSSSGKVRVRIRSKNLIQKQTLFYADKLVLEGNLFKPFSLGKSKGSSYYDYLKRKNIYGVFNVQRIKKIGVKRANPLVYYSLKAKHLLQARIEKYLSSLSASVFNAIILGQRQNLPRQVTDTLIRTGTIHIVAISGLHLAIVTFISLLILKLLRIPAKIRYIFTICFLIAYCIITGCNVPVVRATIMAIILLTGYIFRRDTDIISLVSFAAIVILFINPWQLFEISFQLSFVSVISIAKLTPKLEGMFHKFKKSQRLNVLIKAFSASLAAWLGLFPFIAYYFKIISPVTILANIIVVPYMTLVIACGFAFLSASFIFPPLAPVFSRSAETSILFLLKFVSLLSHLPGGWWRLQ